MRETACVHVRKRRSLLYLCECLDEIGIELLSRDVEILDGTHRRHAVVDIIGHLKLAEEVMLFSHCALSFTHRKHYNYSFQQLYTVYHENKG